MLVFGLILGQTSLKFSIQGLESIDNNSSYNANRKLELICPIYMSTPTFMLLVLDNGLYLLCLYTFHQHMMSKEIQYGTQPHKVLDIVAIVIWHVIHCFRHTFSSKIQLQCALIFDLECQGHILFNMTKWALISKLSPYQYFVRYHNLSAFAVWP